MRNSVAGVVLFESKKVFLEVKRWCGVGGSVTYVTPVTAKL